MKKQNSRYIRARRWQGPTLLIAGLIGASCAVDTGSQRPSGDVAGGEIISIEQQQQT